MHGWALFGIIDGFVHADEEIDGAGFLELSEEDIKKITSKMGLITKLQRLIREVSDQI